MANLSHELAEAAKHWNLIEKRLKEAEQVTLDIVTPAINELRYAGRQIVDALAIFSTQPIIGSEDWDKCLNHIIVARQYLVNADHDITDAVGLWLNIRLTEAIDEFGIAFMRKHVPDFDANRKKLKDLQRIVATSREDRTKRISEYRRASTDLIPSLLKIFDVITIAEELGLERAKRSRFWTAALICLTALLAFAVLALVVRFGLV